MRTDKISFLNDSKINFHGIRVARNTVEQLTKDNKYSLTEPNQRNITNAIKELSAVKGNKNIKFLLNAASKNKYSTNIKLSDLPKNDWRTMLISAALAVVAITPFISKDIKNKLAKINTESKLTTDEKEILNIRDSILQKVDKKQIEKESKGGMKNFERNMDYFIVSSETTVEDKKYVLEKLDYLLSDEYEINPQLKDKKSLVFAEMINDLAIHTPGQDIPNIKAINQKQHGMCAAISIVRKMLAYEDKRNYVDSLLSELDNSDGILVYDRNKLGSGEKTYVQKVPVDFDAAVANGYRIIDASTMHWMQIATMGGASNVAYREYNPFDRKNYDVNTDSFFNVKIDDEQKSKLQNYYQSLLKAQEVINNYKADKIKTSVEKNDKYFSNNKRIETLGDINITLFNKLHALSEELSKQEVLEIRSGLFRLEHKYSDLIKPDDKYAYIPNEEDSVKKEKIKNYLMSYPQITNLTDKDVDEISDLVNYHNTLIYKKDKTYDSASINRAKKLYEVAAAFRYQVVQSLDIEERLENQMIAQKITNKENLVLQTIDKAIEMLQKNSPKSDIIIEQLSKMFESPVETQQDMIDSLSALKNKINEMLTTELDDIYSSMTLKNRKESMLVYIQNLLSEVVNDNKELIHDLAEVYSVKNDKDTVLDVLAKNIHDLRYGSEKDYEQLFDKMEKTSQIKEVAELYRGLLDKISDDSTNDDIILEFIKVNNIENTEDANLVVNKLTEIKDRINTIAQFIHNTERALKVYDKDGSILLTADPKDLVLKHFETKGQIPKERALKELQVHLEKIAKDQSSDEFQTRRGKLKDKTLAQFSDDEKNTLNLFDKSINTMSSYVQKELNDVRSGLKGDLEELSRVVGINNGHYWVMEGDSGLYKDQQIKVLEYMTGRSYHTTDNIKKGIEEIKKGPYSGLSTSSVFHDKNGAHAQYIADIEPVTFIKKEKDGNITEVKREILFNDNSWGASEKENIWIDSNGLERTDYSDKRGGTLGYITNKEYRNGNFVDRILGEMIVETEPENVNSKVYKKLKPDKESDKYPQYNDLIIQGKSPELNNLAADIHDSILVSDTRHVHNLFYETNQHTYEEVKAMLTNVKHVGKSWESTYQKLLDRIYANFGTKIKSQEDYNKLADNDYLKVVLEKIALEKNYQIAGREPELAKVRNVKDLRNFKIGQKARATNSFLYAFSKSPSLLKYAAATMSDKDVHELEKIYDKYNLSLTKDEKFKIVEGIGFDDFDGSLKHTIELMLADKSVVIDNVIAHPQAAKEVKEFFRKFLEDKLYFNEADINKTSIEHIIKFIDREFEPDDNKELVKIYRKMQNMTTDDFKEKVLSKATPEDLGIKDISGYDILKSLQRYETEAETKFINTVFYDSLVSEIDSEDYDADYYYNKFTRTPKYKTNYNFNKIYRVLSDNLSLLSYDKLFNKYKGRNLKTYGAYPAYPKLDYLSDEVINTTYNSLVETIANNVETIKNSNNFKKDYDIAHKMMYYDKKLKPDDILSDYQYKRINYLTGLFLTMNYGDEIMQNATNAAEEILEIPKGSPWKAYQDNLRIIIDMATSLEETTSTDTLDKVIANNKSSIYVNTDNFVKGFVQKRHQARITETINNLKQALIKNNPIKIEEYKETLYDEFTKYHILKNPEELLDSYILSCPADSPIHQYSGTYKNILTRGLEYARLTEVQDVLMDAIENGLGMDAKSILDNYKVETSDGTDVLGSDEMIKYMVHRLVVDNQNETALMFMDKLGLTERYIRAVSKTFNFDGIKEMIKENIDFANDYNHFMNSLTPFVEETKIKLNDDNADDFQALDLLKKHIKTEAKKNSVDKADAQILLETIDSIKEHFLQNPKINKEVVFNAIFNSALGTLKERINTTLNDMNLTMQTNYTIMDLINETLLKENSEEYRIRDNLNRKFTEIAEYQKSLINTNSHQ